METLRHQFDLALPFDEFRVWAQRMRPLLTAADIEPPCLAVLEYVCTEMLNNVLDHSSATRATVGLDWNPSSVVVHVQDEGRGVFAVVREALSLDSDADAALHLLKGKVTTDPQRHTGEGLFFSSRACDWFNLHSASTSLSLTRGAGSWVFETANEVIAGTRLRFRVSRAEAPALSTLFDRFCPQPELRFTRTQVGLALLQHSDGGLVSRSQGKRLVQGLDRFSAVEFDFSGVGAMQQGFADEVFRVWACAHPEVALSVEHADEPVLRMLRHVGFPA